MILHIAMNIIQEFLEPEMILAKLPIMEDQESSASTGL